MYRVHFAPYKKTLVEDAGGRIAVSSEELLQKLERKVAERRSGGSRNRDYGEPPGRKLTKGPIWGHLFINKMTIFKPVKKRRTRWSPGCVTRCRVVVSMISRHVVVVCISSLHGRVIFIDVFRNTGGTRSLTTVVDEV